MIIGTMALAFGFVLASCEHNVPPSPSEAAAWNVAKMFNTYVPGAVTVDGTTVTLVQNLSLGGTGGDASEIAYTLPAGVTFEVSDGITFTLNMTLAGDEGTKLVIDGTVAGSGATNFYDKEGDPIGASDIEGTFEWKDDVWVEKS
jgi:hypothetical protein